MELNHTILPERLARGMVSRRHARAESGDAIFRPASRNGARLHENASASPVLARHLQSPVSGTGVVTYGQPRPQ
jgi:hypothetical protein